MNEDPGMEVRVLLAVVLSLLIILAFNAWYAKHYGKFKAPSKVNPRSRPSPKPGAKSLLQKPSQKPLLRVRVLPVETDLFSARLTEAGGRFQSFRLKHYRQDKGPQSPLVELVSAPKQGLPIEIYPASHPELAVRPLQGQPEALKLSRNEWGQVSFHPREKSPLLLERTFLFSGRSYLFHLKVKVTNPGKSPVKDRLLFRLVESPFSRSTRYVFKGPAYMDGKRLQEVKLKRPGDFREYTGPVSWVAYEDAYFILALLPEEGSSWHLTFRRLAQKTDEVMLWSPEFELGPGASRTFRLAAYFGPKRMEDLKTVGHGLPAALHFGIFDPVAKPLLWCLKFFHRYVGNYGWDIILLTFLVRIIFWPLNHLSYKSMKKMQEIQPVIQRLREKYKDDPQRLQQELMQVYRTYKINPFSGCLPMLIQIPVFFALYKVLLQAIELRHAPFWAWIDDLSAPDRLPVGVDIPYLHGLPVLTILMGVSMYIQQKLSPASLDPTQARLMLIMPVAFTVLFVNFPSGLVLYWLTNNLLSIVQQVMTNKLHAR
ncbi:MAG: membrane protein insertase YidC [Thermodesulfatator sp.]|nr:MAG: membrane protein insertase YidC [Thermodesulfatator sp.]